MDDLEEIEYYLCDLIRQIETNNQELFDSYFTENYFTAILSDGKEVELVKDGAKKLVTFDNK